MKLWKSECFANSPAYVGCCVRAGSLEEGCRNHCPTRKLMTEIRDVLLHILRRTLMGSGRRAALLDVGTLFESHSLLMEAPAKQDDPIVIRIYKNN